MASGDAKRLLPLVARTFAELGYRRATTAMLARRCGVRENVLYRIWPDKKVMFVAAIDHVWKESIGIWRHVLAQAGASGVQAADAILDYESKHHGETGLYKVIFAGLTELEDPDIAAAMRRMYRSFHGFIAEHVKALRGDGTRRGPASGPSDELRAWGLIGIATVANIDRELKVLSVRERAKLFTHLSSLLLAPGGVLIKENDE